ncbi:MAG: UDP-glucose 4-epimerase GalE [Deltaproteobacteria bacterium]|nr:UDP-glucose 4-epimerase GalE [Deltaproteobacteria bacterium]
MRESVLVVGGAGYIGSHTAKLLAKQDYEPVILDNLSTGHRKAAGELALHVGSYEDAALVERVLRTHKITTVMHFGARALVGESVADPLAYYQANVAGTLGLITGMLRAGVKRIVFSSTCATFGTPAEIPIGEGVAQNPVNPYGRTKLFVEQILRDLAGASDLRYAVLRYFNAAGADPEGALGEDHDPETHLIPRAIQVALGRAPKLTVYGSDYPTKDGSCVRDYVHVTDLAEAHVRAMKLIGTRDESFDFNLGSEHGYTVLEIVKAIERISGRGVTCEIGARRPGDPAVLIADSAKARKLLDWRCRHDLDSIIRTTFNWMEKNPNGYGKN